MRRRQERGGGFDPAPESAIVALARKALDRTGDARNRIGLAELVATGLSYAGERLAEIGREPLLQLAGRALRLAAAGEPDEVQIARSIEHRVNARAAGE